MLKNIGVGEYLCTICGCMNSHTKECSCQHDGGYMSDCKCTTKNKLSLYEQLNYINERGFYSVIVNKEGKFIIASTKAPIRRLWFTGSCDTVEQAKEQLGLSYALSDEQVNDKDWQIVDTIHPSELMGKGFQVGDKVKIEGDVEIGTIVECPNDVLLVVKTWSKGMRNYSVKELKPVLPVEEERKKCKKCLMTFDSEKDIRPYGSEAHRNELTYVCPQCYEDSWKASSYIHFLESKGFIKDGKIVNL